MGNVLKMTAAELLKVDFSIAFSWFVVHDPELEIRRLAPRYRCSPALRKV
jgi:hypothetical protein